MRELRGKDSEKTKRDWPVMTKRGLSSWELTNRPFWGQVVETIYPRYPKSA
jgi:hypothetical protein